MPRGRAVESLAFADAVVEAPTGAAFDASEAAGRVGRTLVLPLAMCAAAFGLVLAAAGNALAQR
ncbi:hypothetical protein [Streptomyces sp. NPDC003015]